MKKILLGMFFLVSLMLCFSSPGWTGAQEDFNAGVAAFKRAEYAQAIRLLTSALDSYKLDLSETVTAYYYCGISFLHQGKYSQARYNLAEALRRVKKFPERRYQSAPIYYAFGLAIYKEFEKEKSSTTFKSVIKHLNEAISINPRLAEAFHLRGLCWFSLGVYYKAIADFDMALSINPNLSEAITYRNKALEQEGRAATGQ